MTKNKTKVLKIGKYRIKLYLHASVEKMPSRNLSIRKALREILEGLNMEAIRR